MQIDVIGLGVAREAKLAEEALSALLAADMVIGSQRQLQVISQHSDQLMAKLVELPALSALKQRLQQEPADSRIAILASGDPLWYGIGRWMGKQFADEQVNYHPAISSIQAACHQLGLSLQDVEVISLHGRPVAKLRTRLRRNRTLVILTDQHSNPQALAQEAIDAGFADSQLHICEAMGYPQQQLRSFAVKELLKTQIEVDPLHISILELHGIGGVMPEFPGIPDQQFITDKGNGQGMLSKREVRLQILSLLQPAVGDCIWDLGAGCGTVAVELCYWQPEAQLYAIEHHPERLACLRANRDRFGVVSNLNVVDGHATSAEKGILAELPQANKVFIGGSDGELDTLLSSCWVQLPAHGVLVASAVMEPSRQSLLQFLSQREVEGDARVETVQVAVSRGEKLAEQLCYKPALPVTLVALTKQTCPSEVGD